MDNVKLVIFDCDGVLIDSETVSNQVLVDNLSSHGLNLTLSEAMSQFVGGSMQDIMQLASGMGAALPDNWIDEIYEQTYLRLSQGVDPIEGITDLLPELKQLNVPFCVASNGSNEKMHITLGQTGLLDYFKGAMFSAHELKTWKPDPGLFLMAAKQFKVAPESCVVIEDSRSGTLAAKNAGMACLGYAPEGVNPDLEANGAQCFTRMSDVTALIGLKR